MSARSPSEAFVLDEQQLEEGYVDYAQTGLEDVDADVSGDDVDDEIDEEEELASDGVIIPQNPAIQPAQMWTRTDIKEFKEAVRKECVEGIIKIGNGETATIRVPTHADGASLFWEFASDYYDVGFGVYFEWVKAESDRVTVHISESSDEEDEDEFEAGGGLDPETGAPTDGPLSQSSDKDRPPLDEVIPIYRRDSQQEVYVGTHPYPGEGVYLLKFDNSYSLWRSKTIYYRVYYSK